MSENLKIDPLGFREYDARWLYEKDINQLGITNLGKGLGTQIIKHTQKKNPRVIVGHDYRSYSEKIKVALKKGLTSTGCFVEDLLVRLSPRSVTLENAKSLWEFGEEIAGNIQMQKNHKIILTTIGTYKFYYMKNEQIMDFIRA